MYGSVLGASPLIDDLVLLLSSAITRETSTHRQLLMLQGSVDVLIHASGGEHDDHVTVDAEEEEEEATADQLIQQIQAKKRKGKDVAQDAVAASPLVASTSPSLAAASSVQTKSKSKKVKT